jgi:HprK-related kinase A
VIVSDLSLAEVEEQMLNQGLAIKTGRFNTNIQMSVNPKLTAEIYHLYQDAQLVDNLAIDFNIAIKSTSLLRRYIRPKVDFKLSGITPFSSLPKAQSLPLLEWGLNWCVSQHYHECLIVHAAVVEKNGKAMILPGVPGAGKSTLCAALVTLGGWRLLSDELTLIDLTTAQVQPNPRPISLKNKSIDIIREAAPNIYSSETVTDTVKGSVSLFRAPKSSTDSFGESVAIGYIVFPKFIASTPLSLTPLTKPRAFIELANQSFNYSILAEKGFSAIAGAVEQAHCFDFIYDGNLQAAVERFEQLSQSNG